MSSLCIVHADDGTEILKVQIELGIPVYDENAHSGSREAQSRRHPSAALTSAAPRARSK